MLPFKQYLLEHYVTTHDPAEKEKHLEDAHRMIQSAYKEVGGYRNLGHGTQEESDRIKKDIRDPNVVMKLHRKNNQAKSVMLYKKHHGRKLIAAGTDGTKEGKKSLYGTVGEDNKQKRAYGEVSHKMKHVYDVAGMPNIPNSRAAELTGKEIVKHNEDGSHERLIGGVVTKKHLQGHVK